MAVTIALQANALTTLDRVLLELTLQSDSGAQDSLLNAYINEVSAFIKKHCGRTFEAKNAIVDNLPGFGMPRIRVLRPPIRTLTSVVISADDAFQQAEPVTVDDADLGWLFRRVGFPWSAGLAGGLDQQGLVGSEEKPIAVTYDGGFITGPQNQVGGVAGDLTFVGLGVTLPADLEGAVVQLVTMRWLHKGQDPSVQARSFESSGHTFYGLPIPPNISQTLADYTQIANA